MLVFSHSPGNLRCQTFLTVWDSLQMLYLVDLHSRQSPFEEFSMRMCVMSRLCNFMLSAIVSAWCTLPRGLLHRNLVRL